MSLVEDSLQGLLEFLTSSRCSPTQHLEQEQALARQFAEILHFTLRFDELKVTRQPLVTTTLHFSSNLILHGIISNYLTNLVRKTTAKSQQLGIIRGCGAKV